MNATANLNTHRISTDGKKLIDFGGGVPKIAMPNMTISNMGPNYNHRNHSKFSFNRVGSVHTLPDNINIPSNGPP